MYISSRFRRKGKATISLGGSLPPLSAVGVAAIILGRFVPRHYKFPAYNKLWAV